MNFVWRCVIRGRVISASTWWMMERVPPIHHWSKSPVIDELIIIVDTLIMSMSHEEDSFKFNGARPNVSTISTLKTFNFLNFKLSDRNRWRFAVHFIVETSDIDWRRLINAGRKLFPVESGRHATTSTDQLGGISRRINCWPNYHTPATMAERFVSGGRAAQFAR